MGNYQMMIFPCGPLCNMDCKYCYYLDKISLFPEGEDFMMSEELLEMFIQQYMASLDGPDVFFSWQGGEPTLRGLDFFRKAVSLQGKYLPKGWSCHNMLQTNGLKLDGKWCAFFKENEFLIGLSMDGPADMHDAYRRRKSGKGSHRQVEAALKLLQLHGVEHNIVCTVNKANVYHPEDVYEYFVKKGVQYMQFIPIVNFEDDGISEESVTAEEYGNFLIGVFRRWVSRDVGKIFVQIFEECLSIWVRGFSQLCIFSKTCGQVPVLEHNGDVYCCDHFVSKPYRLGNVLEHELQKMMIGERMKGFAEKKLELSDQCSTCKWMKMCYGGCLRTRKKQADGSVQDHLCEGYRLFYEFAAPYMERMRASLMQ